jgi:predicted ATPase/DNA-binding SARP family transcriptional activator
MIVEKEYFLPRLNLHLLGAPRIDIDGVALETDRRKAIALLVYLAVTGQAHTREGLATLLWPESDSARAYAYLRRTLWELNNKLGEGWVTADRQRIGLAEGAERRLDTEQFQSLLGKSENEAYGPPQLALLVEAVDLYRGDFLAGFSLRDSPNFEEWQFFQTAELRRGLERALEKLAVGLGEQREWETAVMHAHRWLALDPLNESAQRQLMRLYALGGQRSAALKQYENCLKILEEELGVAPQPETVRLWEQIKAGTIGGQRGVKAPLEQPHAQTPRHNLPSQPTTFVGRAAEVGDVQRLVSEPGQRLLTLAGPGGSGKTRLAIQATSTLVQDRPEIFGDGAFFVPLAPLDTAGSIISAVAKALNFTFYQEEERPRQQLLEYLRRKNLLLIMDNYEHLIDDGGVGIVVDILAAAPDVKIMATSRTRLKVRGEQVYAVGGMKRPAAGEVAGWQNLEKEVAAFSAVQLFQQCARQVEPDFRLTRENITAVTEICEMVEGMPLGLELAAGWMELLTVSEIAAEIGRSLDFLETELHDVPVRQRSIRAVFESSWKMLNEKERRLFQQLTVFRGGFSSEAAQKVGGVSLLSLRGLVNKSWLQRDKNGRYQVHELLRQYARERLKSDDRAWWEANDRHSEYFAALLQKLGQEVRGSGQKEAFATIGEEFENMRACWMWFVQQRAFDQIIDRCLFALFTFAETYSLREAFLPLIDAAAASLRNANDAQQLLYSSIFLTVRVLLVGEWSMPTDKEITVRAWDSFSKLPIAQQKGYWFARLLENYAWDVDREVGFKHVQRLITELDGTDERWLLARNWRALGQFQQESDAREEALWSLVEAVAIFDELGDELQKGITLWPLASIFWKKADFQHARKLYGKAKGIFIDLGVVPYIGLIEQALADMSLQEGRITEAFKHFAEVQRLARELGNRRHLAGILHWESMQSVRFHEFSYARELREQSLALWLEIHDEEDITVAWNNWEMGEIYRVEGDLETAEQWYRKAYNIFKKNGEHYGIGYYHRGLGDIEQVKGHYRNAEELFTLYLQAAQAEQYNWSVAYAYSGLGRAAVGLADLNGARRNFTESLQAAVYEGTRDLWFVPLAGFAALLAAQGQFEQALELAAFVANHPVSWRETKGQATAVLELARRELAPDVAEQAHKRGEGQELEKVVSGFV